MAELKRQRPGIADSCGYARYLPSDVRKLALWVCVTTAVWRRFWLGLQKPSPANHAAEWVKCEGFEIYERWRLLTGAV